MEQEPVGGAVDSTQGLERVDFFLGERRDPDRRVVSVHAHYVVAERDEALLVEDLVGDGAGRWDVDAHEVELAHGRFSDSARSISEVPIAP